MSDTTLQERVTKLAEEGFKLLGKTLGQRITLTDASILMDNSLKDSSSAIQIMHTRYVAQQNGKELGLNAPYNEVIDALKGKVPEDQLAESAASYFAALYFLSAEEEQKRMIAGLSYDASQGVPYSKEVLSVLLSPSAEKPE